MPNAIVVLTGAGVSAESGIRTFRAADGLWEEHRVEDVATPEAFVRDPALVQRFYNARRQQLLSEATPNPAHRALAHFQQHVKGQFTLVTQNIDDLHERGGSESVLHMHGELLKSRCRHTGKLFPCDQDLTTASRCPCCDQPGNLRPHVVWFGEMPLYMDQIEQALRQCDLFVSIGTSGNVYPAAGFFEVASYYGAHTVEINLEKTRQASQFDEALYGPASLVVPAFFNSLLPAASQYSANTD